ncbi:Retrovirus-related Pol polyprotein from transposon TNT 1-94 [Araneus ventricosus]|uniref:Retrovirus-related Pol polyprotein from transposon TNT 1-94 n=1 Tax=Araneus ventricosus TaxID=182803 RepID=A0A4Y2H2J2_ARAVE|nr:Retrovirus-related Pol polyprotein from transposon TNT 1-94 [Araneus ventricosus]
MIMGSNIAIEKLSKDNYDSWKLQIEAILVKNDHWNFVTGAERKPEVTGDADNATAVAKWISNDQKAKADIILSIHPSELSQIKNCKLHTNSGLNCKVTANNFTVTFQRNHTSVLNSKNESVLIAKREKGLYYVTAIVESVSIVNEIEHWHQKFGHLNEKDLQKLQVQNMVSGMNFKPNDTLTDCKQTAIPFTKEPKNRSSQLLSVIHSDLCGPMRVDSIGRTFYFATFIYDCSRFVHAYFLRSKDEVKSAFLEFKAYIENKLNCKIKTLRTTKGLSMLD